jgi:LytS/YehU family sensor histidine kinase
VINIDITRFEKTLTLTVSNPVVKNNTFTHGGLGLKNVTRRLELLYPNKHNLTISQADNQYLVNLKLDLT